MHIPSASRLLTDALDLMVPQRCVFCATSCDGIRCCDRCIAAIRKNRISCRLCANPMQNVDDRICAQCQVQRPPFERAVAPLLYEFPVDSAIKALKFESKLFYLPFFGAVLLKALKEHFSDLDGLVAVPLYRWRHAIRGFNQAHELCRYLRRYTGLPIERSVRRSRATATQSGLNADERRRNLRAAFSIHGRLQACRPLIVDDVMTTGETCSELSKLLLDNGADKVYVLTIARARPAV